MLCLSRLSRLSLPLLAAAMVATACAGYPGSRYAMGWVVTPDYALVIFGGYGNANTSFAGSLNDVWWWDSAGKE